MTNNSIFTKVLALMICFVMLVGTLTACFQETEHNHNVGTTTTTVGGVTTLPTTKPTTTTPTTTEKVEDEPVEEPVDPNEIFSASTDITSDSLIYGTLANDLVIGGAEMGALVPADVKVESGASSLALSVKKVDEVLLSDALSTLDVHINGVALDNTVPMIVKLGAILEAGLGATELKLYHTEDGVANLMTRVSDVTEFAIHNQYYYNAETGEVTIYVASFSVFYALKSEADVWDGKSDTTWYVANEDAEEYTLNSAEQLAGFRDLVDGGNTFAGKVVKLGVDIDLKIEGDDGEFVSFDPIGKSYVHNGGQAFMGTFDGQGHTIYNLYQNGWDLGYSYSTVGGGLFASIKDATIKNLAVSGANIVMECIDMGTVVGYAQGKCTFENIVITDSKLANYQRYTGGVVGEVCKGDGIEDEYTHTFINVTVDSSVKISSLWGDFDNACGGVIGGKWGTARVLMQNVTVACEIDAFSDVTAAYQWYAYRRCGMLIGHTEQNSPKSALNAAAEFLTCENVNVYYGDWVNYTYYQFAEQTDEASNRLWNSNYPWVRAEAGEHNGAFSNVRYGNPIVNGEAINTVERAKELNAPEVTITFNQLYGGGQGVYGAADHNYNGGGVKTHYSLPKTFYIENNLGLENLKLHYEYKHGDDTWTTVVDGIELVEINGVYRVDIPTGVESFTITADGDFTSEAFIVSELTEKETYPVHEHEFNVGNECECGATKITATVTISDYANANGWVNDKQYKEVVIGGIKVNAVGGGNTGKYYTNGNNWRIYQSENATIVITSEGGNIVSIKITYVSDKDGVLQFGNSNIESGDLVNVNVNTNSITLVVGNAGSATNGQVRITAIEVVYILENHECNQNEIITGKDATCKEEGLTDGAKCDVCGKVTLEQKSIPTVKHSWVDATCTSPKTCSVCGETEGEALSHTTDNGICGNCGEKIGGTVEPEPETPSTSNRYYIATARSSGNYWYMTSNLGTASTKRYTAVDSGLTVLPESIATPEDGYVFVLVDNGDGTYSIRAEGVDGNNYLGWTSGNSGTLVAESSAIKFTLDVGDGVYNIHFAASDAERYLALNGTSGNNYFAWYKSGQKQDLILIPVVGGDNGGNEGGETPEPEHICESKCATCDKCTDKTCEENVCADKCTGHTTAPTVVLEITKDDFNSTSYAANNNTKTENGYSYTSYQVMNQSSAMQWQKNAGYIKIDSNVFVKLELKVTAGTYTVTVGGKTVTGTTSNGVTTYDLTGLTGAIKISVGSATGKVDYIKFYK